MRSERSEATSLLPEANNNYQHFTCINIFIFIHFFLDINPTMGYPISMSETQNTKQTEGKMGTKATKLTEMNRIWDSIPATITPTEMERRFTSMARAAGIPEIEIARFLFSGDI